LDVWLLCHFDTLKVLSREIMVSPAFGAATIGFLIGIALLLAGIQIAVTGISGRKKQVKILDTRND
jgi:uncharacterized membrane protein HdeD (DUF308 family)